MANEMETGQLVIYTIVTYFDDGGGHQEKEVILFERIGIDIDEARNYVACFRRQQPPEDRPTRRLRQDDVHAVWTQQVVL